MSQPGDRLVIAIDGPAASGKSSTAKAVAAELGYRHLDSGAFYRAVTLAALELGIPPDDWPELDADRLAAFDVRAIPSEEGYRMAIRGEDVTERIRTSVVNEHVSAMAAIPAVRDWLLDSLREAGAEGGLVADGRDIGTVVFPDAELKIFVICEPEERARRRLRQDGLVTDEAAMQAEVVRLRERDRMDETRSAAPLVQAPDAVVLDTTSLDFATQVRKIATLARQRPPRQRPSA